MVDMAKDILIDRGRQTTDDQDTILLFVDTAELLRVR